MVALLGFAPRTNGVKARCAAVTPQGGHVTMLARRAEAQRAKAGARGRTRTCTGDALNVVSLLLDYASKLNVTGGAKLKMLFDVATNMPQPAPIAPPSKPQTDPAPRPEPPTVEPQIEPDPFKPDWPETRPTPPPKAHLRHE